MNGFDLHPYQTDSVEQLRDGLRQGFKRTLLCLPTGGGKTVIAGHMVDEALTKGSKCAFVADRVALVTQTSQRFYEMGIPHGVAQGGNTRGRTEPVQICSAQTLEKRGFWPDLDFMVVDEAHSMRKATIRMVKGLGKPVIGLTATPFTEGLGKVYEHVVNACTTDFLLNEIDPATGRPYLAPLLVYAGQAADMNGAARDKGGEWLGSEVERRGSVIIGDAVSEWVRRTGEHFGRPVKTLVRSATVAHGEEICRAFQAAGYDFRQASYRTSDDDAARMVEDFRLGRFTGLVSVDKFNKGFDVPDILCLIDQRPLRKSLANEIQFLGRGMRAAPGKDFVLVLDHTGNYPGFMAEILDFFAHGVKRLDDGEKRSQTVRKERSEIEDPTCPCGFVLSPGMASCPACGRERPRRPSGVQTVPGRMVEVVAPGSRDWQENQHWTWQQLCRVAIDRKGGDEAIAHKFALAQFKSLYDEWPPRRWGFDPVDGDADDRVARKVKQQLIAYHKRRTR